MDPKPKMKERTRESSIYERMDLMNLGSLRRVRTWWVGGEVLSVQWSGARVCSPVRLCN